MTSLSSHSPSAERRKRLKEAEAKTNHSLQNISPNKSIDSYYQMADRLWTAFHVALDERRLDDAYVFGLRFATFSLEGIPKHAHYKQPSSRYNMLRVKNARQVEEVLDKMVSVTTRMDAEEVIKIRRQRDAEVAKRRAELELQHQLKQQEQAEADKEKRHAAILQQQREELRAMYQQRKHEKQDTQQMLKGKEPQATKQASKVQKQRPEVEQSAMEKLRLLNFQSQRNRAQKLAADTDSTTSNSQAQIQNETPLDTIKNKESKTPEKRPSMLQQLSSKKKSSKEQLPTLNFPVAPSSPPKPSHSDPKNSLAQSSIRKLGQLSPKKKANSQQHQQISTASQPAKPFTSQAPSTIAVSSTTTTTSKPAASTIQPSMAEPKPNPVEVSDYINCSHSEGHEIRTPSSKYIQEVESDEARKETESPYQANLTVSEARTLKLLEDTVRLQERRLAQMEASNEPARLRQEAKTKLKNNDRDGALKCLAKKKHFHRNMDVTKHAIFNMETQIIMLESAVEQREINKIMQETNDVVSELQGGTTTSIEDICTEEKLNDILATLNQPGTTDMFDEEELLSELQESSQKGPLEDFGEDDPNLLLALPSLPDNSNNHLAGLNAEDKSETPVPAGKPKGLLASLF